ncbi:MAG: 23S rRNA pseudouridine(1911/1915/1917) synthase RluD [Gammaproteobacteria bacterium]|nr:MAG: 23S rRNA pseudouridine(1911/1915/1917) synthase RluD [Gammaproteobacteria bacterium]
MSQKIKLEIIVPDNLAGKRLDQAVSVMFSDFSRSRLQAWIKQGKILVEGALFKPRDKVFGGERVTLDSELDEPLGVCAAEPIPLNIVYEDDSILVINKPAGLVVHPAVGNWSGTMQNGLLHHDPALSAVPRGGIIHRLDKDTSGLLVVAKTLTAHKSLVDQLQARAFKREYLALAVGELISGGTIDEPIGRHPVDRKRYSVQEGGRDSVTYYRVEERFEHHTLLRVQLETGRTHQIRVHMSYIRHPLVGDQAYGGRFCAVRGGDKNGLNDRLRAFGRQALHATRLGFEHPETGEQCEWEVPIPEDFQRLLDFLRAIG